MLGSLGDGLRKVVDKISSISIFTDEEVDAVLKDVQRVLLRNDVNYGVVLELTSKIKEAYNKKSNLTKKEALIKALYDELTNFLGLGETVNISKKPFKIMLIGLYGSGKTSTTAKLAYHFKKEGHKTVMVGCDNYRPAAYEQLEQLGESIKVKVFGSKKLKNYLKPWTDNETVLLKNDVILVDTAGRDAVDKKFLDELKKLSEKVKPDEVLLIIPGDLGQEAENLTKKFKEVVNITGLIITKMDASGKGGGALTSSYLTKTPIRFITTGEAVTELESFNPKRFVSRLLGMGDLESLLERVKDVDVSSAQRLIKGEFTFIDFYDQIEQVKKMGGLKKMMGFLPQVKALKGVMDMDFEGKLEDYKIIMQSMTWAELGEPSIINSSRIGRISKGSGKSEKTVRELVKSYGQVKKLSKGMNQRELKRLTKRFGL